MPATLLLMAATLDLPPLAASDAKVVTGPLRPFVVGAIETVLFDFGGTLDADGVAWKERFYALYQSEGLERPPTPSRLSSSPPTTRSSAACRRQPDCPKRSMP